MTEITFCGIPEGNAGEVRRSLDKLKELGLTSVQTYIHWHKVEPSPGAFDWSFYDQTVDLLGEYDLKWVPFLIAGPWYVTPAWVREEPETVFCRCLEHGRDSKIISLHSPNLSGHVQRLLKSCSDRYLNRGVLESVLLGVNGDYGEAIYSVLGNWPGKYHGHLGYWCGEEPARLSFRRYLEAKYRDLDLLNQQWQTRYDNFFEINPVLRADVPSPRAWLDQMAWYRGEMLAWSRFWLQTAKECFPGVEVYLCTGGDGTPQHGSDLSAQCRLAAELGAGIRITNEGSDYVTNFLITRLVGAASRHYGCYFGYEPASWVDERGVAARIYNAAASGARQLFEYVSNFLEGGSPKREAWDVFLRYRDMLTEEKPEVDVAVFLPLDDFALREVGTSGYFRNFAKELRGFTDYDLIDKGMVSDGALSRYRFLFIVGVQYLEAATVASICQWVGQGGVLFSNVPAVDSAGGGCAWNELLGLTAESDRICAVNRLCLTHPELTPRLAAGPELLGLEGYTQLAGTVTPLAGMRDMPEAHAIWVNRWGRGLVYAATIKVDFDPEESDSYAWFSAGAHFWALVQDVLAESKQLNPAALPPATLENGTGVYATAFADRMLLLNFSPEPAARGTVIVPGYGLAGGRCSG